MLSHPYLEYCPRPTGKACWPGKAPLQSCAALVLGVIFALTWAPGETCGQEDQKPTKRTIYVPFDDLPVILGGPNQRVFLTREEFEELQKLASKKPSEAAPVAAILLESRYEIDVKDQLATIQGTLEIEVLNPGLHTVALPMSGVHLRSAQLDDQPAPVGRDEAGKVVLFVQGEGRHRLDLELQTPVTISAAQQSLELQLPQSGSSQLLVNVPGNVEVKSGATVINRQFDEPTEMTQFELMASRGPTALVMSLNNRRLRDDRVVVARGVYVSEMTTTYERLHATISLDVLHGAVDQFLLDVPTGFQVTDVSSPLMSQWVIRQEEDREVLDVKLREATRAVEVINIAAIRTPVDVTNWKLPKMAPRDVASHVAVVGLLAETHLQPQVIQSDNLIRIDTGNLTTALPPSLFDAEPGAPQVRPIVAFYAPQDDYTLQVSLKDPLDELRVATHLLLSLGETQQDLRGGFTLTPLARKRMSFSFRMPSDWQLTSLYVQEGQQLKFDQYREEDEARYVVTLPTAMEPGVSQTVYFQATRTPSEWLNDWQTTEVPFPHVTVADATLARSALAVQADGDFTVKPNVTEGLSPLDSSQRTRFGLDDSSTELTFQFNSYDFQAQFEVERIRPRISTRNYSFFRIREGALIAHYEVVFIIERAHARKLELQLPASTPAALAIRGLDGVELKEFTQTTEEDQRNWSILLATPQLGTIRLAVDFEQRLGEEDLDDLALPVVKARDVAYQTQMTAVEGDSALDIQIETPMRPVDIGELAEAEYTPGRRLLGAFASTAADDSLSVDVTRRNLTPLPTAIVQRAEMVTLVSSSGKSQTSARYLLRTKVPFLAIRLPEDAELWSVALNGKPIKPRRRGEQVLLGLQTEDSGEDRDLQVVFQAPVKSFKWVGRIATDAPLLWLVTEERDQGVPVPQVDLVWRVFLPNGFEISRVHGTVFSDETVKAPSPAISLARTVLVVGGGVHTPGLGRAYRTVDSRSSSKQVGLAELVMDAKNAPAAGFDSESEADYAEDSQATPMASDQGARPQFEAPAREFAPPATRPEVNSIRAGGALQQAPSDPFGEPTAAEGEAAGSGYGGYPGSAGAERFGSSGGMGGGGGLGVGQAVPPTGPQMGSGTVAAQQLAGSRQAGLSGRLVEKKSAGKYWALQGLRSLNIDLDESGNEIVFRSLGADPTLDVRVFHQGRMQWFAMAVAAFVLVLGLVITRASLKRRFQFVVLVTLLACGLPLLGGPFTEFTSTCEMALFAVIALIPIWTLIAFGSAIVRGLRRITNRAMALVGATAAMLIMIGFVHQPTPAAAQDLRELLKPLLDADDPVQLPDNAIVVPYDPTDPAGRRNAEKILVPYSQYVALWNLAYPDRQIDGTKEKYGFSMAGAGYSVVFEEGDDVVFQGYVDIQVFSDEAVEVPLALRQGVIANAKLDNKPARLKAVQPAEPAPQPQAKQQKAANAAPAPPPVLLTVLVEGKGRHRLDLSIRVRVTRRGGWRFVNATLPHAEASALSVSVPAKGTHVRWSIAGKTHNQTTEADAQTIESVLGPGGTLDLSWRPMVSAGSIDQALTGNSTAVVDLREDGIRVLWQIGFEFGQTERGLFQLEVPRDYLVEKVDGSNVRGWDLDDLAGKNVLNVELLKSVKQRELFTVHLSRRFALAAEKPTQVDIPVVSIPDAALHRGTLRIRRSPILDLQTVATNGVTRSDAKAATDDIKAQLTQSESPLGVQDYQAYEFKSTPYSVRIAISEIAPQATAELRTLARIGESESTVESEIVVTARRRPIYSVRIKIPEDLKLDTVGAAQLSDWSIVEEDDARVLNVYFVSGQEGRFTISLQGKLSDHAANQELPLPNLEVLDIDQQRGVVVIQVDPSLGARLLNLNKCSTVLLNQAATWLTAEQRPLARLAVQYQGTGYSGAIAISPRTSRITCDTVTNVRLTYREIQETILLDFRIERAGVRQVVFRLPSWLRDAQVTAPMIRQQTVESVEGQDEVRVTLDLQDAMTGQYRVVIENDRAITPDEQSAPLPWIETGSTNLRYVTLENAGRDEVLVGELTGFEPLNRQSRQWQQLANRLRGGDFTTAYVATDSAAEDSVFTYGTKRREIVKTAGATIGLARTTIVVDGSGAYRASQLLKVDNRTEPHLEIELPESATLWTAHVADRPVKPSKADTGNERVLRIPLVKTAEGDLDYPVLLKYGGTVGELDAMKVVQFPVIRTVNIDPELSQIKLLLPESHRWLQFDGTAQRVDGEDDFMAGYLNYRTQQVQSLTQILRGKNDFSKTRASGNIKNLDVELKEVAKQAKQHFGNEQLRRNLELNTRAIEQASQEMVELEQTFEELEDNRDRLNKFYAQQQNTLARNSVTRLGKNFVAPAKQPASKPAAVDKRRFDNRWFSELGLGDRADKEGAKQEVQALKGYKRRLAEIDEIQDRAQMAFDAPEAANAAQKVFKGQAPAQQPRGGQAGQSRGEDDGFTTQSQLSRAYEQKIEQQNEEFFQSRNSFSRSRGRVPTTEAATFADGAVRGEGLVIGEPLAGLASLDLDIPDRGVAYYFTTPGKDVTIKARPITNDLVQRAVNFAWLFGIAIGLGIIFAVTRRLAQSRRGLTIGAVALMIVGIGMLVTGVLPLFALVLMLGGILILVEAFSRRSEATA